jgi:tetratricopeptide (TPR) repeat protein
MDGNEPLFHQNLGTALAEAGQHGEAIAAFSRALELDPGASTDVYDAANEPRLLPERAG